MKYDGPAYLHPGNRKRLSFFTPLECERLRKDSFAIALTIALCGTGLYCTVMIRLGTTGVMGVAYSLCVGATLFLISYCFDSLMRRALVAYMKYLVSATIATRYNRDIPPNKVDTALMRLW
jgi:hypothetical protein